jgi:hypothetical protein
MTGFGCTGTGGSSSGWKGTEVENPVGKWWRSWPFSLLLVAGMLVVVTAAVWSTWLTTAVHDAEETDAPPYMEGAFGDWTDTDDNGCDQRIDALVRDLHNEKLERCRVSGGWLVSPYTGILLEPGYANDIPLTVNHVVSERWAWDHGAWRWDGPARVLFYNDLDNLMVVESGVQRDKAGLGPEDWLPDLDTCAYTQRFVEIVGKYGLDLPVQTEIVLSNECDLPVPNKVEVVPR